jgi:hypothetical protein
MSEKNTILINQPVDREAYKKIKVIATMEERKIQDVVNEAFIFFAKNRPVKK